MRRFENNERTIDGAILVTEGELYGAACMNYKIHCTKHNYAMEQPSPELTIFDTSDDQSVIVFLYNDSISPDGKCKPLYVSMIGVSRAGELYQIVEKGL